MENHNFWKTQPILNVENKKIDDIDKNAIQLPEDFSWYQFDLDNEEDLDELYNFLLQYYVLEKNAPARFHYSKNFLKWFLKPKEFYPDLIIGVKLKYKNKYKLVATICGIPMTIKIKEELVKLIQVNFLCIHHTLRSKRLSPVLIKEITRRANLHNIWQAFFTADIGIPNIIYKSNYYYRIINVKKLHENDKAFNLLNKLYSINEFLKINLRQLEEKDIPQCYDLFKKSLSDYKISIYFNSEEEFKKHFYNTNNSILALVVEEKDVITDFISFYNLPHQVSNNPKYDHITNAYLYYYFTTKTNIVDLLDNSLVILKKLNFDVLNCTNCSRNNEFLEKLKFTKTDGILNFYFYNYNVEETHENQFQLVMV